MRESCQQDPEFTQPITIILHEQIGSEVIYVLPTDDPAVVKKFEQLFAVLDRYMAKLRIKSYGLSDTTLEEVIMGIN